jgi:hypothetical protein
MLKLIVRGAFWELAVCGFCLLMIELVQRPVGDNSQYGVTDADALIVG